MKNSKSKSFTRYIKGKVIIAFLTGCIAFGLFFTISNVAFEEMLKTVKDISEPNENLKILNSLYRDITRLDQFQRIQAVRSEETAAKNFLQSSKKLRLSMDSLQELYADDPKQLQRIDSMKKILTRRDTLFINYLKVREGLVNIKGLSKQLNSLSGLISKSSEERDSSVITTEERKLITTIIGDSSTKKSEKGFLGRLFGKKKEEKDTTLPREVVTEEIKVKIDTLALSEPENVIREMEKAVQNLEYKQRQRSRNFVNREIALANAGNVLVSQMLSLLQEVEREAILQAEKKDAAAKEVVDSSAQYIRMIMLAFLIITALLFYFILADVSKSNEYRRELEAARDEAEYHSMAKQRFLSSMSHEIRTPLQSIIGYSDLIRDQEKPKVKFIEAIHQSSLHLLHIVNEVLDYSRIISGKFKFQREVFCVNNQIEEVISIMRPQAEKKSLLLKLDNRLEQQTFVWGDAFRLKQILINLLGNAVKFTDEGTVSLEVSCKNKEGGLGFCFKVEDTGHGISPENIEKIFNEFEQEGDAASNNPSGTGLGLSIVKALIEGQGGSIEVKSEPGKGSCFAVRLRYKAATKPEVKSNEHAAAISSTGKVWVVDDDRFILQLCSSVFDKYGIKHSGFNAPAEVLAEPWDNQVRLVLLDMRMPGMTGVELCKILKAKLPEYVKIYALTAQVLPEEQKSILGQGFDGLLPKPFREEDLLALVQRNFSEKYCGPSQPEKNFELLKEEPKDSFNLEVLEKMTFGDKAGLKRIVDRYVEDTWADLAEIKQAMRQDDSEMLLLLLHRVAGRTAQLGAKEIAANFREEEMAIQTNKRIEKDQEARISEYVKDLDLMVSKLHETMEAESYSI